jgi:Zn finger protein HypA/HybF involved in hydrogenase expression
MATFKCRDCGMTKELKEAEDPTNSAGACKCCGGRNWVIVDEKGTVIG